MDVFCLGLVVLGIMAGRDVRECYKRGAISKERIEGMVGGCGQGGYSETLRLFIAPMLTLADEERITARELKIVLRPLQEDILRGNSEFYRS